LFQLISVECCCCCYCCCCYCCCCLSFLTFHHIHNIKFMIIMVHQSIALTHSLSLSYFLFHFTIIFSLISTRYIQSRELEFGMGMMDTSFPNTDHYYYYYYRTTATTWLPQKKSNIKWRPSVEDEDDDNDNDNNNDEDDQQTPPPPAKTQTTIL